MKDLRSNIALLMQFRLSFKNKKEKIMKKLILIFIIISYQLTFAQSYEFFREHNQMRYWIPMQMDDNNILLCAIRGLNFNKIVNFNIESEEFTDVISHEELSDVMGLDYEENRGRNHYIRDLLYIDNSIYLLSYSGIYLYKDNELKEIDLINDEFGKFEQGTKHRQFYKISKGPDNSLLLISKRWDENTEKKYYDELYQIHKNGNANLLYKGRFGELNSSIAYDRLSTLIDDEGNIYFLSSGNSGGLNKIDRKGNLKLYEVPVYSNASYGKVYQSLNLVDNKIYITVFPDPQNQRKMEGASIFDIETETWETTRDFLEWHPDLQQPWGDGAAFKIKKVDDNMYYLCKDGFIVNIGDTYKYIGPLSEIINFAGSVEARDIFLNQDGDLIVITGSGLFKISKDILLSVAEDLSEDLDYRIISNRIEFLEKHNGNYMLFDIVGRTVDEGRFNNYIDYNHLTIGTYFLIINNKHLIKIQK